MVLNCLLRLSADITNTSLRFILRSRYLTVSTDSENTTSLCCGLRSSLNNSCFSNSLNLANLESSASVMPSQSSHNLSRIFWSLCSFSIYSGLKSSALNTEFLGFSSALALSFSSISSSDNPASNILLMSRSGAINTLSRLNMSIMFWLA